MSLPEETIRRAADGDRSAQEEVYRSLSDRLYRSVIRIVGSTDADDVTQEVFVTIFRKMRSFRFDADFTTWAHRVAINEALQFLRRARRKTTVPLAEAPSVGAEHERVYDAKEVFNAAFASLATELQLILELREGERNSYAEIAELLGISEGTVGSRLNRARGDLRVRLKELGWE